MSRQALLTSEKTFIQVVPTKRFKINRERQDEIAFNSHKNYSNGRVNGFFDDLILPIGNVETDGIPRSNTSLEQLAKLNPVFDTKSGQGSITAGNSSLLSDGAAGLWVCGEKAKDRFSKLRMRHSWSIGKLMQ